MQGVNIVAQHLRDGSQTSAAEDADVHIANVTGTNLGVSKPRRTFVRECAQPQQAATSTLNTRSHELRRLKKIISHAKEYGFVFSSSEIYDGLSAAYDYGQLEAS